MNVYGGGEDGDGKEH